MLRDTEWVLIVGGLAAFLNAVTVGEGGELLACVLTREQSIRLLLHRCFAKQASCAIFTCRS